MSTRNYITARGLGSADQDNILYEVYMPYSGREVLFAKLNPERVSSDHFVVQGFVHWCGDSITRVESVPEAEKADLEKRINQLGFIGRIVFL